MHLSCIEDNSWSSNTMSNPIYTQLLGEYPMTVCYVYIIIIIIITVATFPVNTAILASGINIIIKASQNLQNNLRTLKEWFRKC